MKNLLILFTVCIVGCAETNLASVEQQDTKLKDKEAKVVSVKTQGKPQDYTFNVGISSPDTGCNQYANWWEVLNEEGKLLYRRILAHSHVKEQPFERLGGPVVISDAQQVIIRAHMNNSGYGKTVFKGSVKDGFKQTPLEPDFAIEVKSQQPQPSGCAF
ncbi:MAG: hypothetical protein AAF757_27805 [Cyanobacteria bacterium P01_D01_bin.116]